MGLSGRVFFSGQDFQDHVGDLSPQFRNQFNSPVALGTHYRAHLFSLKDRT
jgi:hypothetical protein